MFRRFIGLNSVIYQTWGLKSGALKFIDDGFVRSLKSLGYRVYEWNASNSKTVLSALVKKNRPELLLLNLQTTDRNASPWCESTELNRLIELKEKLRFHVACRSSPSNLEDLYVDSGIDFDKYRNSFVWSFYKQPQHPTLYEKLALTSGFIDLIRSAFHYDTYSVGFRNYLELGIPILEEPHAADTTYYKKTDTASEYAADVLFVGGCWDFKWDNMKHFVIPLKKKFGNRFKVYGRDWPQDISEGVLPERHFNSTICASKINLTLHEISQTTGRPISGNERIFKLGALQSCVISDNNAILHSYFDTTRQISLCQDGDEMVERINCLLEDDNERTRRRTALFDQVKKEHTYLHRIRRVLSVVANPNPTNRFTDSAF